MVGAPALPLDHRDAIWPRADGVRDAENRVRFLGYSATSYKLFAFVLSAMMAGLAGALYVPQVGIINPGEF